MKNKTCFNANCWLTTGLNEEQKGDPVKSLQEIRALYDAGAPLFTKTALRNAKRCLEASKISKDIIPLKGLNGEVVMFNIETGRVLPAGKLEEYIVYVTNDQVRVANKALGVIHSSII